MDKDEGISDEEDPAELRVLLDLNEQEASQLRRKVEELEKLQETNKKQIKELQEKAGSASSTSKAGSLIKGAIASATGNSTDKIKAKDKEISELKMKLNEKDRAIEKMKADQKKLAKTTGEAAPDAQTTVNHKRQIEMVEQEASVLRGKVAKLEQEIESITTENKKLTVQVARLARKDSNGSIDKNSTAELVRTKDSLAKLEKENAELQTKLKEILEVDTKALPTRTPKKFTDMNTKMQLQKMIGELEDEVKTLRAMLVHTGGYDAKQLQEQLDIANTEIGEYFT